MLAASSHSRRCCMKVPNSINCFSSSTFSPPYTIISARGGLCATTASPVRAMCYRASDIITPVFNVLVSRGPTLPTASRPASNSTVIALRGVGVVGLPGFDSGKIKGRNVDSRALDSHAAASFELVSRIVVLLVSFQRAVVSCLISSRSKHIRATAFALPVRKTETRPPLLPSCHTF